MMKRLCVIERHFEAERSIPQMQNCNHEERSANYRVPNSLPLLAPKWLYLFTVSLFLIVSPSAEANPIDLGEVVISFSVVPLILLFEVGLVWLIIRSYIENYREFLIKWFFVNVISWLGLLLYLLTIPNLNNTQFEIDGKFAFPGWKTILSGEALVVIFEGFFLYSFMQNDYFKNITEKKLSPAQCLIISMFANLASFLFPFFYSKLIRFSGDFFFNLF